MARDEGRKYKATFGLCVMCENFFKHGEYGMKDGLVLCDDCRKSYDADTDPYKRTKYGGVY